MKCSPLFWFCISLSATLAAQSAPPNSARIVGSYGRLPLAFEANQGQTDPQVKFLTRGAGYSLFLMPTEAVLALQPSALGHQPSALQPSAVSHQPSVKGAQLPGASHHAAVDKQSSTSAVLRMKLVGANSKAEVMGQDELPGKSSYFIGNDPKKWHTNVRQFAKVRYGNVYPGVDLVYYGHQRELEYDFVLQPRANPAAIHLGVAGAKKLRLEHGDLVLTSAAGDVHLRSPHIYQEVNGVRHEVHGHYVLRNANEVGFLVGSYDRRRALTIDPVLAYSTYLGGSASDTALGIAVDSTGNAYVAGETFSSDFPIADAIQTNEGGESDAFVTKINADGSALIYSTYLGGSGNDRGNGIAVDLAGDVYVTGFTQSIDFPTANAIQPAMGGGFSDAFVTKFNAQGSALLYSTYLGGSDYDEGYGIAVDSMGNGYITGATHSTDFPAVNAIQPSSGGDEDVFVTEINAGGSAFVYSTYLGGSGRDEGLGIAVDSSGNAYITGLTESADFPTVNAIQMSYSGEADAFVTEINTGGKPLVYSTYFGGSEDDVGEGIAVDLTGNAFVTGSTYSPDFPVVNAIQPTNGGQFDAFVMKVSPGGTALGYSTYLGGSDKDYGDSIAIDSTGNVYVAGYTDSTDFPILNAIQLTNRAPREITVTEINSLGSALIYSTYLGGSGDDYAGVIAVDAAGSAYIAGISSSNNFPATPLAFQTLHKGSGSDGFIAKIAQQTFVSVSPDKLSFPLQVVGTTSKGKKVTLTNQSSGTLAINRVYIGGLNPGDFAETNTCGSTLATGASCTIFVTFTPTDKNKRQATLGISDSDPASPQGVALSGSGTVVLLSTKKLSFGDQPVGTSSAPQSVTLTNAGSTQLNFTGITITGTNTGDFSQTNSCGTSIAAGASCTITVTFTPSATGTRKATVSIGDDGGGSPQKVTLTGTGT